jgi:hypothetical protein
MRSSKATFKILSSLTAAGIVFSLSGWGAAAQRERRPLLDGSGQPADRPVLSCGRGPSFSALDLWGPAGQFHGAHRQPRGQLWNRRSRLARGGRR